MVNLIGLYGPSRSGKDETAGILVRDFGFEQRAMAEAIREILLGLNPLILDNNGAIWTFIDLYKACNKDWDEVKAQSREAVDYMINLGQSCRDALGEDVWINKVLPSAMVTEKIVISDVRQPNEYETIKARGGQVWRIVRPGTEKRGMDGLLDSYDFDNIVYNNGSLVDLRGIVQASIATCMSNERIKGKGYGH